MSIVKMKKLQLFAIRSQKEELLNELMMLGCVEVTEAPASEDSGVTALQHETSLLPEYRAQHTQLSRALSALNRYSPEKTGLFTRRATVSRESFFSEEGLDSSSALATELVSLDGEICGLNATETRESEIVSSLTPWKSLASPLEMTHTRTCSVLNGTIPAAADPELVREAVSEVSAASETTLVSSGAEVHCLSVVCIRDDEEAVEHVLRKFGFTYVDFGQLTGTAADNIAAAEAQLELLREQKSELVDKVSSLSKRRTELKTGIDYLGTKMARAEAAEKLLRTDSVVLLSGWVPVPRVKELEELLTRLRCAWELTGPLPEEASSVPICLKDNVITRQANMITEMYSLPSYNGVDPNPFIMPFFCLFFGIMFADLAYGLILLIIGLVIKLKIKPKGTLNYAGGMLIACGIMSMVFGAITGNFFGDAIPVIANMYGKTVKLPTLIDIFENPMVVLIGSLVIGFIHIMVGLAIKAVMLIREGLWFDALCDVGSIWLLFAGIALGALGKTWIVAIVAVVLFILAQGRNSKSIGGKIGSGLWELYNTATGYFGDILSYSRLMALMLAGSVIASVFNTLGAMGGNIVFFIVLFIVGHALNMALNIIGTFVHTSRLQYLEFFGKFYRDGGKPFEPLTVTTNNVDIINKED